MRLLTLAPLALTTALIGLTSAQGNCNFDNAYPWPSSSDSSSDSSSSGSSLDPGEASQIINVEGAADAQAICDADLSGPGCTTTDSGDGGILRRQMAADAAQSITCTDTEYCLITPSGYLLCIDPTSYDFVNQDETGNLESGIVTSLASDGSPIATFTYTASSDTAAAATSDVGTLSTVTTSATTSDAGTVSAASTTTTASAATAQSSGGAAAAAAAASQAVGPWGLLLPAAMAVVAL